MSRQVTTRQKLFATLTYTQQKEKAPISIFHSTALSKQAW